MPFAPRPAISDCPSSVGAAPANGLPRWCGRPHVRPDTARLAASGFSRGRWLTLTSVLGTLAGLVAAGPVAASLDLAGAVALGRDHDARVQAARWSVSAASERLPQARAGLLPALSAGAAAQAGRVDTNLGPDRNYDNFSGTLDFRIPVYRPAERAGFSQARLGLEQAEVALGDASQALVLRVAEAYIAVLEALDTLEVVIAQRRAIQEQFEAARRNFEVGTATITDQQEAQARLDLNLAQLVAARNDLAVRRAALTQLTGRDEPELNTLKLDVALPLAEPDDVAWWVGQARTQSYPVRLAEAAVALARGEIGSARAGHHPTLDIVSQAQWLKGDTATTVGSLIDRSTTMSIGLQLAIPLYSGGLISAREREAVALLGRADSNLEDTRRQAEQATREAFLGLSSSREQARALAAAVRSSELALESNRLGYRVGVRINVDVLEAQQLLFQAYRDHARARYQVLLSTLRLRAAAGVLADSDVAAVNALLTPRENRSLSGPAGPAGPTAPGAPNGAGVTSGAGAMTVPGYSPGPALPALPSRLQPMR